MISIPYSYEKLMSNKHIKSCRTYFISILCLLLLPSIGRGEAIIADHSTIAQFESIPSSVIDQIKANHYLYYGHTSHGSQIVTGMSMLMDETPLYDFNNGEGTLTLEELTGVDLGTGSEATSAWVTYTRNHLDLPGCQTNVVIWSWCGGVSISDPVNINNYLNNMTQLENDYPQVTFVYMTGHLDGSGPDGNLYILNNQIRDYCINNGKVLFDFADIESYDPDGNYYPDASDACEWCYDWCAVNTCDMCPQDCAHSHCFNCYLKGKAFWWMLAAIDSWHADTDACGDANSDGTVNILDIVYLINFKYKNGPAPDPLISADVNSDGIINILDIIYLINNEYKGGPAPNCPET